MAVGGIGNYYGVSRGYYDYQSSVNNLKLQQALTRYNNTSAVPPVNKVNNKFASSMSDSLNFVNKYNSQMSELMNAANALRESNSASLMNQLSVNTSNDEIISASSNRYRLNREQSLDVNVQQLAAAQENVSEGLASRQSASGEMNLTIEMAGGGTYDFSLGNTKPNGAAMTNEEQLTNMAQKINLQKMGVTASVETKDGVSTLKLTSDKTGEDAGFQVSGSSAADLGLDEASVEAQDAIYTVSEDGRAAQTMRSSTNNIELADGKVAATLNKTGKANVNIGINNEEVVSATEDLINKYNKVVNTLHSNSDRGSGVINQLSRMVMAPASEQSLSKIGITKNDDGTLNLDKDKLTKSLKEDPDVAKEVLGGSSGLANGAFQDAVSGMNQRSSNLMNYDMEIAQNNSMNSSVNFLNMYSKMGSVNLMNLYATGLFYTMTV